MKKTISIVSLFALAVGSAFGLDVTSPFSDHHCRDHSTVIVKLKNSAKETRLHFSDSTECHRIPCDVRRATLEAGEEVTLHTRTTVCNHHNFSYNIGSCPKDGPVDVVKPEEAFNKPMHHDEEWVLNVDEIIKSGPKYRVIRQKVRGSECLFHVREWYNDDMKCIVIEVYMTDGDVSDEL